MENSPSMLASEAASLFYIYDRAGVGEISKHALLSNLATIDGRITEEWLNKILLQHGIPLKPYITCAHFIKIMEALSLIAEEITLEKA